MKVVVLISCMNEKDFGIIDRTNLRTDAVIINQTDNDSVQSVEFTSTDGLRHNALFVNTQERGLSRSRNMAIDYAKGADICLLCDDDEWLEDDYEEKIVKAYMDAPSNIGLIAFAFTMEGHSCPAICHNFSFKDIMRTSSVQISFKRDTITRYKIRFDELMGSGTGNGGGEENRFLMDVKKTGVGMMYVPYYITTVQKGNSKWNNTISERYLSNLGWSSRRVLGFGLGAGYIVYHALSHYKAYAKSFGLYSILCHMFKGFFDKR